MQPRKPLGRGLSALLPGAGEGVGPREIDVDRIDPDPEQPRQSFDDESIASLAESITRHGVLQPVIVRRQGERFVLLAGERRLRASRVAGLRRVPAILREDAGLTAFEIALVENLQREDLNPLDEASAYRRLLDEGDRTQTDVAALVGKSRAHVANMLRLLGLSPEARRALADGAITSGHARAILSLPDDADEATFLARLIGESWSVRRAEREARALSGSSTKGKRPRRPTALQPYFDQVTRELSASLGVAVRVKAKGHRGALEIPFTDLAALKSLCQTLQTALSSSSSGEPREEEQQTEAA